MSLAFCSLASGSKGNCYLLASHRSRILIDAGISAKSIINILSGLNILPESLNGIIVTHEHGDHISGVRVLSRRYDIPVYANEKTMEEILLRNSDLGSKNVRTFKTSENFYIGDIDISPFSTPHDSVDSVGFCLYNGNKKITIATDLGHINQKIMNAAANSDLLVLEANHDLNMLVNGSYPQTLKKRIQGKYGHLSNEACGRALAELCRTNLRQIILAHLSDENNHPDLAHKTVCGILESNGIAVGCDLIVDVALQLRRSNCYEIK